MKSFRLLTQQIGQWWRGSLPISPNSRLNDAFLKAVGRAKRYTEKTQMNHPWHKLRHLKPGQLVAIALRPQSLKHKPRYSKKSPHPQAIFAIVVVSLTSTIGYRFYNEPQLAVDTIAPQTLRAPDSAVVEDTKTTEENRKAARTGSIPVLMIDQSVNQEIYQSLQRLIDQGDDLRGEVGAFPFVETSILSINAQRFLRQADETQWQAVITALTTTNTAPLSSTTTRADTTPTVAVEPSQQLAFIELQNYRRTHSAEDFTALKQVILRTRQRYVAVLKMMAIQSEPSTFYDASLLNLTDTEWAETERIIRYALERMLAQGIPPGLPDTILEEAITTHIDLDTPHATGSAIASQVLMAVLKPNLVQDAEQTRARAEQAARAVEPVLVEIRRGEVIVRADEKITQADFVLLDYFGMSRRRVNWLGLIGFGSWIAGAMVIFLLAERYFHPGLRRRDYILTVLLILTIPPLVALGFPATSLPLVGLLVGSFYGSAMGVVLVILLGITLPIGMEIGWSYLIATTTSSLVGALMAGKLRSREELALLGFAVGLTQGVTYLLISLILSTPSPVWYGVLTAAGLQGLLGIAWSVVAMGISPYLEHLFDLVTPIRLAELSNPNRPLLKRLASEAPGTFQHTLFVASLAEAAARALGCNVELVRAGTLYHDIGKMHDPKGFIENQMGGPNKHDAINDPWKSADIIKKHVGEGLVMARKYRLPKAIQAFIPEHQGTMLIAYFYHAAQQLAKEDTTIIVNEIDFRYDGPIPQTRETGIVMLADSCEAALRSLREATPEEALAMVNRILRARWQDHQLVDCGITRAEMNQIAEIFVQVWLQYNHQRIAYPKLNPTPQSSVTRH